jgi:16S rRNA (adenine1518-N6/adenine1519-N6)-dimethyltransferase
MSFDHRIAEQQHTARKRFGQNFLIDHSIIDNIVASVRAKPEHTVVEIGPGKGAITEGLVRSGARLHVVELDRDLHPILEAKFGANPRFTLHAFDALKFDFGQLVEDDKPLRVVGNLPYNISTPLIFHLLSFHPRIADMHFMLQREVVQRLAAQPGSKSYGRLSVMAQYFCVVQALFDVPPGSFDPPPKVQSAIVRLVPHAELPLVAKDYKLFDRMVVAAFSQRRKTLRNTLRDWVTDEQFASLGIDPSARAETLTVEQFVSMANMLSDAGKTV